MSKEPFPILHVYGPSGPHDEPLIVGSREALERLRDAIDRSLERVHSAQTGFFTADGEGFDLHVLMLPEGALLHTQLPYTDYPGLPETQFPITPGMLFRALAESQQLDPQGDRRKALDEVLRALFDRQ